VCVCGVDFEASTTGASRGESKAERVGGKRRADDETTGVVDGDDDSGGWIVAWV